jgi:type IV pilus biogenesis protein CpaD/CtpE
MKRAVLGIVALLLLTGCASSPSLEDQTKLAEYEKCLDFMNTGVDQELLVSDGYVGYLSACDKWRP